MTKENETEVITFHNEGAISRISLWANIVGYTILVFAMIGFAYQLYDLSVNGAWAQIGRGFREQPFQLIAAFATQIFMEPLKGVFYFLVLRGVSQLLSLGLDLYYADVEEVDMVVEEDKE